MQFYLSTMAIDSRKYREYLHQTRSHPATFEESTPSASWKAVSYSLPVCLALEWYLEVSFDGVPPGLAFPFGFFLFWGFYYSQIKQSNSSNWKADFKYFSQILNRWIFSPPAPPKKAATDEQRPSHSVPRQKVVKEETGLPKEIENALGLLGLKGCRDWKVIHKRYRELAKKFHPDLNPELTSAGNRFMIYDGAYRRLYQVKDKYFSS